MPLRNLTETHNFSSTNLDTDGTGDDHDGAPLSSSPSFGQQNDNSTNDNAGLTNPFMGSDEESNARDGESLSSSVHYQPQGSDSSLLHDNSRLDLSQNKGVSDYKGYYSRNNSRAVSTANDNSFLQPPHRAIASSPSLNSNLSKNDILSPPEFDRYPLVGSRVTSMTQLNHHGRSPTSSPGNESSASFSSNPFLGEKDFSPFGGYPASSFPLMIDEKEEDDYLHNPDPEEEARLDRRRFIDDFKYMDKRSASGLAGVLLLFLAAIFIFIVLPALTFTGAIDHESNTEEVTYLTQYQYPQLSAIRTSLVDPDTPDTAKTREAMDGSKWELVFSDEFNAEGRTFYDGDDPYWTAPDVHYDATKDLEWYSPDASTTVNGTLQLRMDAFKNHGLYYRSGMLQSWNKVCFTQGALEISANLPNYGRVSGLWPGLWTMGNLGRPGYLASTQGVWPYSYESCDAGITPNQSSPDGISYLPGQKLSICTCDGEDHPNQGVGRGAPEIDVLEGETDTKIGVGIASQSLQIAPFDIWYMPDYDFIEVYNFTTTTMNTYAGGPFQQAVSAVSTLNVTWYEFGEYGGYFQKYAIEYLNDDDNGYIRWFVGDTPTYTIHAKALHPDGNIGWRRISKEPMSIILNLGISNNWAYIDWQYIFFPVVMSIDYVRIYQPSNAISVTCDPSDYPTYDYIQSHLNAFQNANLTTWEDAGYTFPKNILTGKCTSSKFKLSS
ncbi:AFI_G0056930.mRNA.1.CDS.1 [Saccharomyces cerevisiae]|nr:AFI_G0056930.mRNA.1.CDS.1 [Saccharomyces cerevisiae]CAI6918765.1 AFI_G0056930.mRNA.1.CDS.1 [Saccharomyces cerevisiae]